MGSVLRRISVVRRRFTVGAQQQRRANQLQNQSLATRSRGSAAAASRPAMALLFPRVRRAAYGSAHLGLFLIGNRGWLYARQPRPKRIGTSSVGDQVVPKVQPQSSYTG